MTTRLFAWRDIPVLQNQQEQRIFLDSALLLTRGHQLVPAILLSSLAPSMGIVTCVVDNRDHDEPSLIGQFLHTPGSSFAHLTFLTLAKDVDAPLIFELLDFMAIMAGSRGAMRMLAEIDEMSGAFEAMRRSGFAIFSRQRIWQMSGEYRQKDSSTQWRNAQTRDAGAIRALYNNIVPGLVQQVEPFDAQRPHGLVYLEDGEVVAYVELRYGRRGVWAQPFVHPDAEGVVECFVNLVQKIPGRYSRPVYICVRSYQSWMEQAIQEAGAESGPRQAVMVKHLASQQKASRTLALPALEGSQPEITAPIAQMEINQTDHGTT